MSVELKELQEKLEKLLHDTQEEYSKIGKEGKSNSEQIVKMQDDFGKMSEAVQKIGLAIEAETKAREEVELALSRMKEVGGSGDEIKGCEEYSNDFHRYCVTKQAIDIEALTKEAKAIVQASAGRKMSDAEMDLVVKTLLVGSNPDGGYLVPVARQADIKKRMFETTPMRSIAQVVTIGTEAAEWVLDDQEATSEKVGELDTRNNTATPQIGIITIPTHEQSAIPVATQKILDDAVWNMEAWLSGKIADRFARVENWEFINGSAAHEAQGICVLPDWETLGIYERNALETRLATTTTTGDDLLDLQSDLLEPYQGNARWLMHRKIWVEIMKLKDSTGQYLLNPMMLFSGASLQLLGRPVVMAGDMSNAADAGEIIVCYGDFREGYAIVDRIGIRVLRDPYTVKGFVQFYTTKRTGGGVVNFQAIKRLRIPEET